MPTVDAFPVAAGRKFTLDGIIDGSSFFAWIGGMTTASASYTASYTHGIKMLSTNGNFVVLHVGEQDIDETWDHYIFMTTWNGSTLSHSTVHTDASEIEGFTNLGIEIVDATTIKILHNGTQVGTNKTIPSMGTDVKFGPLYRATATSATNSFEFDNAVVS